MNSAPDKSPKAPAPEVASLSVSDTFAALHVNAETGLARADVETRRTEHGFNEVTERKGHPVLVFLSKSWGLSAWMLEFIMVLSDVWTSPWLPPARAVISPARMAMTTSS